MNKNQETELKLEITENIYNIFRDKISRKSKKVCQINHFFDSKENHLLKIKWTLRIRIEDDKAFITAKGPGKKNGAIYSRPEYESDLSKSKAENLLSGFYLSSLNKLPVEEAKRRVGDLYVSPFLSFKNERIYFEWRKLNIELDKTIIKNNIFYEIEIETNFDKCKQVEKEIRSFFTKQGWIFIPSKMSKFKRAFNLLLETNN